jgi:hypothetical protein
MGTRPRAIILPVSCRRTGVHGCRQKASALLEQVQQGGGLPSKSSVVGKPGLVPGFHWVVEEDISQGCSFVFIHDCGMFLFEYDNLLQTPNLVGSNETDYDNVPDRNFKFIENLYTVFSQ